MHQRRVPYPELPVDRGDQEERWTGQPDAAPQLPNALARASPDVKPALVNVNDNTRAMATPSIMRTAIRTSQALIA
ncbi:hypothetical protein KEM55_007813 [Ascosphaera atra]|nr:hypothetical protein KEM55_007813 [Ascosphaera atra]